MELININVGVDEILRHQTSPEEDIVLHGVRAAEMPDLYWYRITSLGFGYEKDGGTPSRESEIELLDSAAALFASSRQAFSLLCERKDDAIVYAVGCHQKSLGPELLKSAFGTVKAEEYVPVFSGNTGLYAHDFETVRNDVSEMGKRDSMSNVHISQWVDETARSLIRFPGMVRLDFQPVSPLECTKLISDAREICDHITTYLESSIQAGDNVSVESRDNIIGNLSKTLKGDIKYNKSSNASVSWKPSSCRLSELKKEAEYFLQIFLDARKQGWTVEVSVSADTGLGELLSSQRDSRETALSVPLTAALIQAGYTCSWSRFRKTDEENSRGEALLLPAAYARELISFPTTSFYGFERVKNNYYNVNLPSHAKAVPFGTLMQYEEETTIKLSLPEKEMNRHIFICGMTGSGKTNTVHHLLSSIGDFPYLVIEPVKGEYHSLPGVKAYTMTAGSSKALYLNPFWFPEGSSLQYHIDYLKQIISSAFDLYAAMPNILEQCLILVYQHCGWDFIQNKNRYAADLPESMLYPTFSDLCHEVDRYLENAKFGEELKGNYQGALLARLQSFTSGPKGMLLNTPKHLSCDELSRGKVVISLDSLADDADKSIVMGVIIAQYYEYLKTKCVGSTKKELQHLVVIEEAHHLFAGDSAGTTASSEGGSGQNSSQELVKTLNNMLAEIRAYGEGFLIVDQSPSALHPSVLKNTGIKIAHRIDYGRDIEAMGDALLLDREDRELAALCPGQALVHYGGMRTSAKVQVPACHTKEESVILEHEEISGSSVVSTLLEDSALTGYIKNVIIDRVIHHLLYDELDHCLEAYKVLCVNVKSAMVEYGHYELFSQLTEENRLPEYLVTMLPPSLERIFPHQHRICKMICLYIDRFLNLASETNGELTRSELRAFENYRMHRLEAPILNFFRNTDIRYYKEARPLAGCSIDLNLICKISENLNEQNTDIENMDAVIRDLLPKRYFLCMPENPELIIARAIALSHYKRRKKTQC